VIAWRSNAPDVATVSSVGVVTAVGSGRATITAAWEHLSATAEVEVEGQSISLELQDPPSMMVGGQLLVTAMLKGSDGHPLDSDAFQVSWSSDPGITEIAPTPGSHGRTAVVTGLAPGRTAILAAFGQLTASVMVDVRAPLPGGDEAELVTAALLPVYLGSVNHSPWGYAPILRIHAGHSPVTIQKLTLTPLGLDSPRRYCTSLQIPAGQTADLNREFWGDFEIMLWPPQEIAFQTPVTLTYQVGDGEPQTYSFQLILSETVHPTESMRMADFRWGECAAP
jgi:hypothetical protein